MTKSAHRIGAYHGETGVGGLLLLFVLTQLVSAAMLIFQIPRTFAGFSGPTWALGADSTWFPPTLVFEAASQILRVVGTLVGLVLLFARRPATPRFYRAFLAAALALAGIDALLITKVYSQLHATLVGLGASTGGLAGSRYVALLGDFRSGVYALLWLLYWRGSERVRQTFARERARRA